jgi:hypothetical protein
LFEVQYWKAYDFEIQVLATEQQSVAAFSINWDLNFTGKLLTTNKKIQNFNLY